MKYMFNISVGYFLTGIFYILGGYDKFIEALLVIMVIDYITGLSASIYNKRLSKEKGFKGILKKGAYICLVVVCVELDRVSSNDSTWRNIAIGSLISNDLLSIFENLANLDVPISKRLKSILKVFDNDGNKINDEEVI